MLITFWETQEQADAASEAGWYPDTLAAFIENVAPQVRERVAERRASSHVPATPSEQGA